MANFWEHESEAEYSSRLSGRFRRRATQTAFRRFARSSVQQRGIDPDTLTALGSDVTLSPEEMGLDPRTSARLTRLQKASQMTQRELGARAQSVGAGPRDFAAATPGQRGAAASAVGEDYRRRQELLEDFSPEQIEIWTKVARRADEIVSKQGLEGPHPDAKGIMVKDGGWDEAYQSAQEDAIKSLSWDEIKLLNPSKGVFGDLLGNFGKFMGFLETQPLLGGPLARTTEGQFPAYDPEGTTGFERGAALSRPVARDLLEGQAIRFEMLEQGFEDVTGVHARPVSSALRSGVAEDILTEVINPAALVLVAPMVMQATAGLRGTALAAQMSSNLLGTGMEPALVRGTLRGLTLLRTGGIRAVSSIPRAVTSTRVFQRVLYGEAGGARIPRPASGHMRLYRGIRPGEVGAEERLAEKIFGAPAERARGELGDWWTPDLATAKKFGPEVYQVDVPIGSKGLKDLSEVPGAGPYTLTADLQQGASRLADAVPPRIVPGTGWFLRTPDEIPTMLKVAENNFGTASKAVKGAERDSKALRAAVKAGEVEAKHLDEAVSALAQRRRELRKARTALDKARVADERASLVASARAAGADDNLADILGRAFDESPNEVPPDEALLIAGTWHKRLAALVGNLTGTPPGAVGRLATKRDVLLHALRRYTLETVNPIFKDVEKMLKKELPHITYTGETKWASEAMGTYKAYHVVQHPEWFDGLSFALKKRLGDAQDAMRSRLETAKSLGYPIEALDDAYLEQLWEIPASGLTVGDVPLPGRVSVAKPRYFDDYLTGLNQGFTPRDLSVRELMEHSSGLLDEAISDAWMRQEILRRFGKRGTGMVGKGTRAFSHTLYHGYAGPDDIVNWVNKVDRPVGSNVQGLSNLSAAMRGTVFGLADIAVTGVQFPLSFAHGGIQIGVGTLNRSLEMLNLPYARTYMKDATFVSRCVAAAQDGLHIGIGPSAIKLGGGTVVKYAPRVGKAIDKPISFAIDKAAQAQFGSALTSLRLRMYEGNLLLLRMVGKNIDDPVVRRMAAEWANSCTGASRGPMVKGRRAVESILLTSTQMTRANLSVYGQLLTSLSPKAGRMERLRAATVLANLGAYTYGIQYLFNGAFGDGPQEWVPGRPNWATVRVGGMTVPIIPQRSILRGIDKSLKILERHVKDEPGGDLADIAKAWAQVAVGKGSPLVGIPLGAVGIGFEPETGQFHLGGLSEWPGKGMAMVPAPPIAEQALFQEKEALPLTAAVLGFNPYATSSGTLLREEFKLATVSPASPDGEDINWESPAHTELIESTPKLNKLWEKSKEESREYGSQSAITVHEINQQLEQAEKDKGIVSLAEAIKSGDAVAALQWSGARGSFLGFRDGKWDERFTARDPKTEIGRLVNEYYAVDPMDPKFTDPSGVTDWGAFQETREEVLGRMPLDDANAIRNKEKFINPAAEAVDKEFRAAQKGLRPYWDLKDDIWQRLQDRNPDFRRYPTMSDFRGALAEKLVDQGVPQQDVAWRLETLPVISNISGLLQTVRFQYRLQNPEVDSLLVKWYGSRPARTQEGAGGGSATRGRFGQRRSR